MFPDCNDGTELSCDHQVKPQCGIGESAAIQNSQWKCVSARTCLPNDSCEKYSTLTGVILPELCFGNPPIVVDCWPGDFPFYDKICGCGCLSPQPEVEITTKEHCLNEAKKSQTFHSQTDQVYIDIHSVCGVGNADVNITAPDLPLSLVFRLYLGGLEDFRMAFGDTVIVSSIPSTGEHNAYQSRYSTDGTFIRKFSSNDLDWMNIRIVSPEGMLDKIPLERGFIEIEVPSSFLLGGYRQMSISWIDFYK